MALTPNQKAYSKELHRIQTHIERLKREGLTIKNVPIEQPKRITKNDINDLKSITPAVLREQAEIETKIAKQTKQRTIKKPKKTTDTSPIGTKGGAGRLNRSGNPSNLQHKGNPKNLKHTGNPQGNPNAKPNTKRVSRGADKVKRKTRADKGIPRKKQQLTTQPQQINESEVLPMSWQVASFSSLMNVIDRFSLPAPKEILESFLYNVMNEVGIDELAEAIYKAEVNGHAFYEAILYDSEGELAAKYSFNILEYLNINTELKNTYRVMLSQYVNEDITEIDEINKGKIFSFGGEDIQMYEMTTQVSPYVEKARRAARKSR